MNDYRVKPSLAKQLPQLLQRKIAKQFRFDIPAATRIAKELRTNNLPPCSEFMSPIYTVHQNQNVSLNFPSTSGDFSSVKHCQQKKQGGGKCVQLQRDRMFIRVYSQLASFLEICFAARRFLIPISGDASLKRCRLRILVSPRAKNKKSPHERISRRRLERVLLTMVTRTRLGFHFFVISGLLTCGSVSNIKSLSCDKATVGPGNKKRDGGCRPRRFVFDCDPEDCDFSLSAATYFAIGRSLGGRASLMQRSFLVVP